MAAHVARLRLVRESLSRNEWSRLGGLASAVLGLHLLGFGLLVFVVAPRYSTVLGLGMGLTAWGFGLRHAFDADHISAIDNTTRKLMADGRRPLAVGFFFSLGHSTVVFTLCVVLALFTRSVAGQVTSGGSTLHSLGGSIGTGVSGAFLYLIAIINLVILLGIVRIFRDMRHGRYDEQTLEQRLAERGFLNRLLGPLARSVKHSWQMYPIGLLFGLGFDTATEVGLLALAATAGGANLPWYAILCLPVIFAAGMSMMDTADGAFMSVAYGWAFSNPVRKVFYNLVITGLSVGVAGFVGTIELVGIVGDRSGHGADRGGFWGLVNGLDLNTIGFAIVGMFVVTWIVAVSLWFFGGIEERWTVASAAARRAAAAPPTARARKPPTLVAAQTWLPTQACLMAMGVLYMAISGGSLAPGLAGMTRALAVAGAILAAVAAGALLVSLAIAMDRAHGLASWLAAGTLEAAFLVLGIVTAPGLSGPAVVAAVGLPLVGLVLLLAPQTPLHLRRPRGPDGAARSAATG